VLIAVTKRLVLKPLTDLITKSPNDRERLDSKKDPVVNRLGFPSNNAPTAVGKAHERKLKMETNDFRINMALL